MDDVLTLIRQKAATEDDYGIMQPSEYERTEVMCRVHSITRAEFFEGGRNGLNPVYRFTMFHGDYSGERIVEYRGESYAVYRTYRTADDYIELYVQREGGANGKGDTG